MKKFLSVLLIIVMMMGTCLVPAIGEEIPESEEDTGSSITRTGDEELEIEAVFTEEDEDEYISADSILPTSNDRVLYLALSEDEETGHAVYVKFTKPEGGFVLESEDEKAIVYLMDAGYAYSYSTGSAARDFLAELDMESTVAVLEGFGGVDAWKNAANDQACALIQVPGAEDACLLLTVDGAGTETSSLEDAILYEVERLTGSIELWDSEDQQAQETGEEEITPNASVAVKSVKLNKKTATIYVKGTQKLTATISPSNATNKKVKWSTSNSSIATVSSNGTVTAKKAGSCTITAKSNNGKTATCKVTVKAQPAVKSVSIVGSGTVTLIGGGYVWHAVCQPSQADQTVTWTSSNPKVATVTKNSAGNGVVTPKGYGTATITATSKNGKKATRKVIVEKRNPITRSYVVTSSTGVNFRDTMTIFVDGVTGKVVDASCSQSGSVQAGVGVSNVDIKVFKMGEHYVEFKSRWKIFVGVKIGSVTVGLDAVTYTYHYRLTDDGMLTLLKKSH